MKNVKNAKNNKGFSLVELIVVIAIMAVLVGVLAPQFIKYVEESKRSTDISNAQSLASAYLSDVADGTITTSVTKYKVVTGDSSENEISAPSTWNGSVATKGSISTGYYVTINVTAGTCDVYIAGYKVTDTTGAVDYKKATAAAE